MNHRYEMLHDNSEFEQHNTLVRPSTSCHRRHIVDGLSWRLMRLYRVWLCSRMATSGGWCPQQQQPQSWREGAARMPSSLVLSSYGEWFVRGSCDGTTLPLTLAVLVFAALVTLPWHPSPEFAVYSRDCNNCLEM